MAVVLTGYYLISVATWTTNDYDFFYLIYYCNEIFLRHAVLEVNLFNHLWHSALKNRAC